MDELSKDQINEMSYEELLNLPELRYTESEKTKILKIVKDKEIDKFKNLDFKEMIAENNSYLRKQNERIFDFLNEFGIKNTLDFDIENDGFLTRDNGDMMQIIWNRYEKISQSNKGLKDQHSINEKNIKTKENIYEAIHQIIITKFEKEETNDSKEPFRTIDDYYDDFMDEAIEWSNLDTFDYRELKGTLGKKYPEIFLDDTLPEELKNKFYEQNMSLEDLEEYQEYENFFENVNLDIALQKLPIKIDGKYNKTWEFFRKSLNEKEAINYLIENRKTIEYLNNEGKNTENGKTIIFNDLNISSDMSVGEITKTLQEELEKRMTLYGLKYNEEAPEFLKEKCPQYFLDEKAPEDLKNVFYDNVRNFWVPKSLRENTEWKEYLLNKDLKKVDKTLKKIVGGLDKDKLKDIFNFYLEKEPDISINIIKNLKPMQILDMDIILDEKMVKTAIERDSNSTVNALLFSKNISKKTREQLLNLKEYTELNNDVTTIDSVISNIYLADKKLKPKDFEAKIGEVYNLLTYNNVPEFIKTFKLFELGRFANAENEYIESYKNLDNSERNKIILADLFRISLDSNNKSLREFAEILKYGEEISKKIKNVDGKYSLEGLTKEELSILNQYTDTMIDVHNLSISNGENKTKTIESKEDVIVNLQQLAKEYGRNGIDISSNIILKEMLGKEVTSEITPEKILAYMDKKLEESQKRNIKNSQEIKNLHLEPGDYIKGISSFSAYLPSMLKNGLKGGEFNQEYSHSDCTPLDLDFGIISNANIKKAGKDAKDLEIIQTNISGNYGANWIVLKQYENKFGFEADKDITFARNREYWTKVKDEELDKSTQGDRYVRTGVGSLDIDYIVTNEWNINYGYEMAMAGIYIPVKDKNDELVFAKEDYDKIREQMKGLSYYNADKFEVESKAKDVSSLFAIYRELGGNEQKIEEIKQLLCDKPDQVTIDKKEATVNYIKKYFENLGIKVSPEISANLSKDTVELIDTGSTGRGTNVPGDGDFDFMLRHNCSPEVLSDLEEHIASLSEETNVKVSDGIRSKDAKLPDGQIVDIDLTYAPKDLKLEYTSDMSVKDRLNSIKKDNPEQYKYVIANIVMAKNILKQMGVYKKIGSDGATEHGGFGGIGVENWILQNGGSFEKAIDTYLDVANSKDENGKDISYDEFVQKYPIYDFGSNHREGKQEHDKFSSFLNKDESKGFKFVKDNFTKIQEKLKTRENIQKSNSTVIKQKQAIQYKAQNKWKKNSKISKEKIEVIEEEKMQNREERSKLRASISIESAEKASQLNFKIFSKQNFVLMSQLASKYVNKLVERKQEQYERG